MTFGSRSSYTSEVLRLRRIGFGLQSMMEIAFLLLMVVAIGPVKGRAAGDKPCMCTYESNLVCGSDGVTYSNPCFARCSGATVIHGGKCENTIQQLPAVEKNQYSTDDCPCPLIYRPVCGSDGRTYNNECLAKCNKVKVLHDGPCKVKRRLATSSNCFCNYSLLRVCGNNGVTYDNPDCAQRCGGVTDYVIGACDVVCKCTKEYDPVCHVITGTKYANRCYARCLGADSTQLESCD